MLDTNYLMQRMVISHNNTGMYKTYSWWNTFEHESNLTLVNAKSFAAQSIKDILLTNQFNYCFLYFPIFKDFKSNSSTRI